MKLQEFINLTLEQIQESNLTTANVVIEAELAVHTQELVDENGKKGEASTITVVSPRWLLEGQHTPTHKITIETTVLGKKGSPVHPSWKADVTE